MKWRNNGKALIDWKGNCVIIEVLNRKRRKSFLVTPKGQRSSKIYIVNQVIKAEVQQLKLVLCTVATQPCHLARCFVDL